MGRKDEYKLQNEQYLEALRAEEDIKELPCGIFYRVLESGNVNHPHVCKRCGDALDAIGFEGEE